MDGGTTSGGKVGLVTDKNAPLLQTGTQGTKVINTGEYMCLLKGDFMCYPCMRSRE